MRATPRRDPLLERVALFTVPKADCKPETNQDSSAFELARGTVAIADGVTMSYEQAIWANLLVRGFCDVGIAVRDTFADWVNGRRQAWAAVRKQRSSASSDWLFGQNDRFAAATFLGIEVWAEAEIGVWAALLVGDACVFHLRPDRGYLGHHPPFASSDFGATPSTLGSAFGDVARPRFVEGHAHPGDVLLLATDALAKAIIKRLEKQDASVFDELLRVASPSDFAALITRWRSVDGTIDDDDTTLARAVVGTPRANEKGEAPPWEVIAKMPDGHARTSTRAAAPSIAPVASRPREEQPRPMPPPTFTRFELDHERPEPRRIGMLTGLMIILLAAAGGAIGTAVMQSDDAALSSKLKKLEKRMTLLEAALRASRDARLPTPSVPKILDDWRPR